MTDGDLPRWDEAGRVAVLRSYDILDTPREADFDDIARMASEICGTPIALVSLVDSDRQFFKAEIGLGLTETPIETSFCAHALLLEETMVVRDATLDPRFVGNPLVTGAPGLRFYAGALLRTAQGVPLGTLCVLDYQPRELDERQRRHLGVLARQAMTQIELRRILRDQREALRLAEEADGRRLDVAREMSHRIKNTLAIVQAIVKQTFQLSGGLEASRTAIVARIEALARAQDILTAPDGSPARIAAVVGMALAPHRTGQGRFSIDGPDFELAGPQALGLTLALHELASNAAKHGALSGPAGRVRVTWTLLDDGRLDFDWLERDGPRVTPPARRGFGSRLLERIVAGYFNGTATLDFEPVGMHFRLLGKPRLKVPLRLTKQ